RPVQPRTPLVVFGAGPRGTESPGRPHRDRSGAVRHGPRHLRCSHPTTTAAGAVHHHLPHPRAPHAGRGGGHATPCRGTDRRCARGITCPRRRGRADVHTVRPVAGAGPPGTDDGGVVDPAVDRVERRRRPAGHDHGRPPVVSPPPRTGAVALSTRTQPARRRGVGRGRTRSAHRGRWRARRLTRSDDLALVRTPGPDQHRRGTGRNGGGRGDSPGVTGPPGGGGGRTYPPRVRTRPHRAPSSPSTAAVPALGA